MIDLEQYLLKLSDLEQDLLKFLDDISKEKIKIEWMNPEYTAWMGNLHYKCDNGYSITVFSDCFCFDYIDTIRNERDIKLFDYVLNRDEMPLIAEYYPSDEIARRIYHIHD